MWRIFSNNILFTNFAAKGTYISVGRNNYSLIRILMSVLIVNILGSKNAVNVPDRSQCEDLNKYHKVAEWFFIQFSSFSFLRTSHDLKRFCFDIHLPSLQCLPKHSNKAFNIIIAECHIMTYRTAFKLHILYAQNYCNWWLLDSYLLHSNLLFIHNSFPHSQNYDEIYRKQLSLFEY